MKGFQAWLVQRVSAIYLALFVPLALIYFIFMPPQDHAGLIQTLKTPWVFGGLLLFVLAWLVHVWVGLRDIMLDYVKPTSVRLFALSLVGALLLVAFLWFAAQLFNLLP